MIIYVRFSRFFHQHKSQGILDVEQARQYREQILQLRASMGQLYNAKDLPIPFFYVHFICLLTSLYLPLFAVTSAVEVGAGEDVHWSMGIMKGLVVLLQSIFVLGLRVLGQKMSDPYGDDLIDLSVMFYVNFTWTHSNRILRAHFPEAASVEVEKDLIGKRSEDVGMAFEPDKVAAGRDGSAHCTGQATTSFSDNENSMSVSFGEGFVQNGIIPNPTPKNVVEETG